MKRYPVYPKPENPTEVMKFLFDHDVKLCAIFGKKPPGVIRQEAMIFGQNEVHVTFDHTDNLSFTDLFNTYYIPGAMQAWHHFYGKCEHSKVPIECPICTPPKNLVTEKL